LKLIFEGLHEGKTLNAL
jgi:hypothetical protein